MNLTANSGENRTCVIIGASHGGVNAAFQLRKEGFSGQIRLYDRDPEMPYHRPPLSKSFLTGKDNMSDISLRSPESFAKEKISLHLGIEAISIDREQQVVKLNDGSTQSYDVLILATGSRAWVPPIQGIELATRLFTLRTASDARAIKQAVIGSKNRRILIIGGGYIGLETAASIVQLGADVVVLEREPRLLPRVASSELSAFFLDLHTGHGVDIHTNQTVEQITSQDEVNTIQTHDGSTFLADIIIVGTGIVVNQELAERAGLMTKDGVCVDGFCRTSDPQIYALGDCTMHTNTNFDQPMRLESVQNAVDQAKVVASHVCGRDVAYDAVPWFWSDQFDTKLQMAGLSDGYDDIIIRPENGSPSSFSIWYFRGKQLLAVEAVNQARAYMMGLKSLRSNWIIDKSKLNNPDVPLKPANMIKENNQ